jgi:molecular chaperone GrpE (heat shock protein)
MVFSKINKFLNRDTKRYDNLYHNYSKVKLDLKNLEVKKQREIEEYKEKLKAKVSKNLIVLYENCETLSNNSHKIKNFDKEVQTTLLDINVINKKLKEVMKRFDLVTFKSNLEFVNLEEVDVLKYVENSTFKKGQIIKTIKKGIKFEGEIIKKPSVIVVK